MIGARTPRRPGNRTYLGTPAAMLLPAAGIERKGLLLRMDGVSVRNARQAVAVQNVALEVRRGEIVGVAGVDGSGQRELSEAIVGLRRVESGRSAS